MTKEELKQEAEEWLRSTDNHLNEEKTHFLSESEYAERAYLAGAEPREKRIQEKDKKIAELEKENAELKEKYAKNITDCDICDTYCNSQLTKAKELIEKLLNAFSSNDFFEEEELIAMAEAENFLKESEVEK